MTSSTQIVKCLCDASLPYIIKFFNVIPEPTTDPGQPPKFTEVPITIMKKDTSNYWVGITGDINITYSYNPIDPNHVIEKNRLSSTYYVTEIEYGKINVYVDFDNYNQNEWQIHDSSKEEWASSVFSYDKIKPHSKDVLMAHITGSGSQNIQYARLNAGSLSHETPGSKKIAVYDGICEIGDSERVLNVDGDDPQSFTLVFNDNTTFTSELGCAILVVVENDI